MNDDFATAMGRALGHVRAGDPGQATRLIQSILTGTPAETGDRGGPETSAPRADRATRPSIDLHAEEAEVIDDRQSESAHRTGRAGMTPGAPLRGRLRDVVKDLSRKRPQGLSQHLPGHRTAPPAIPAGARYEWRAHVGAAGGRDYRLYVPATLPDGAQGLVVMLHGCTQDSDDFASGTAMNELAERHGLIVAYPSQTRGHNAQGCWNWFRPEDQARESGEPAILAAMTRELVREFDVNGDRVFVAGLSAGGAMAAILAEAYPDLFAAVGVHSGLPAGSASDVMSAFAAMRGDGHAGSRPSSAGLRTSGRMPRVIVFHGSADATVHSSNGDRIVAAARGRVSADAQERRGTSPGGRSYTHALTRGASGAPEIEHWLIDGAGHAWSGGAPTGSYTDPTGPDASAEMVRFFLAG